MTTSTRASTMVLGVKAAVLAIASGATAIPGPATFKACGSLDELVNAPRSRMFVVMPSLGSASERTVVTGITGTGQYWVRVEVAMRHILMGQDVTAFTAAILDDHRIVADNVLTYFHDGGVTGATSCDLDGSTSLEEDVEAHAFTSHIPFRISYDDTVAT